MLFRIRYIEELLLYLQMLLYIVTANHEMGYDVLCPYSNLCQSKSYTVRPAGDTRWPCCVQCSCVDTCHITKRCCPDKVWRTPNGTEYSPVDLDEPKQHNDSIVTPECKSQKDLYNHYLGTNSRSNSNDFYVIYTCPETPDNETMADTAYKCSHGNHTLTDIQFVSDVNNEFLYFNKYCAQCNGVHDVIDWHLKAECTGSTDLSSIRMMSEKERDNFTISHCGVSSVPPSEEVGSHFLCDPNTIKTCNVSGQWDFYDADLERNCKENKGSLFKQGTLSTFKNVYCFLCNMKRGVSTHDLCDNPFINNASRSTLYPFTYLIKPNYYKTELIPKRGAICGPYEIWDYFMSKCRQLLCPYGTIPSNGKCKPLVDKLGGIAFHVYHKLNLTFDIFQQRQIDYHPWMNMIRNLTGVKYLEDEGCILCSISSNISPSGDIQLETTITTTESCSVETALTLLHRAARGGSFLFRWKTYDLDVNVELLYDESSLAEFWGSFMNLKHLNCRLGSMFRLDLVHCPGFRYEKDELMSSNNAATTNDMIITKSSKVSNETYMICYKQYKELWEQATSASASTCYDNTFLIFLINCIVVISIYTRINQLYIEL